MRKYCFCRRLHRNPLFLPGLCDALLGVHPAREMPTFEGRLCLPPCRGNTPCGEAPRTLRQQQHGGLWRTRYASYTSLHCQFNEKDVTNIYWSFNGIKIQTYALFFSPRIQSSESSLPGLRHWDSSYQAAQQPRWGSCHCFLPGTGLLPLWNRWPLNSWPSQQPATLGVVSCPR